MLHCPVDVERFTRGSRRGELFLVASRLLPYKRIELAIDAAALAGERPAAGRRHRAGGADAASARAERTTRRCWATSPTHGSTSCWAARARPCLPGEEDFGLVPLEAAAAGRPTIAYRGGGALETIVEGETGAFFDDPTRESLARALRAFDASRFEPCAAARARRSVRAPRSFVERLRAIVERVYREKSAVAPERS